MLACISGCRGVIGFNVATSQLPVREKFALRTKNGPKSAFVACWANFFANIPLDGARWANYFAPVVAKVVILTDSSSNRAVL